jgi:hypothetical protein
MALIQLPVPIAVLVVSDTLPKGVTTTSRRGYAIGWLTTEEQCLWNVAFDETGELVWVPMREVRLRSNWSVGRRLV